MYTRSVRQAFVRGGCLTAALVVLVGCRSTTNGPVLPTPDPKSVHVGYGSQDARDVNGAVSSASGEKLRRSSPRTVADMLIGRFPGVEVRQLRNGSPSIRIRGSRSFRSDEEPLIVLDGTPQQSGPASLLDVSPRDVESIEVLRDAAATSVYGSRGSNGVILISTRRGAF